MSKVVHRDAVVVDFFQIDIIVSNSIFHVYFTVEGFGSCHFVGFIH